MLPVHCSNHHFINFSYDVVNIQYIDHVANIWKISRQEKKITVKDIKISSNHLINIISYNNQNEKTTRVYELKNNTLALDMSRYIDTVIVYFYKENRTYLYYLSILIFSPK